MAEIINQLLKEPPCFYTNSKDVALSSKIRLIRNLKDFPFPTAANSAQKKSIREEIFLSLKNYFSSANIDVEFLQGENLSNREIDILIGLHYINSYFTKNIEGKGICLSKSGDICIIINETDHIIIQSLSEALSFKEIYLKINDIDNYLLKNLDIAFSEEVGFLTSCPSNVGTALKASTLLHIPIIITTNEISEIAKFLSRKDILLKSLFDRNKSYGDMFKINNTVTLGKTEEEIIEDVYNTSTQIIKRENELREKLISQSIEEVQDRINKSFGIVAYAKFLSLEEAYEIISLFRMAKLAGLLNNVDIKNFNGAFFKISSELIRAENPNINNLHEENKIRAELLRKILNEKE